MGRHIHQSAAWGARPSGMMTKPALLKIEADMNTAYQAACRRSRPRVRKFGLFLVHPQLGCHGAAEEGHFQGVLENVLAIAGAVLEPADQVDQLGVHAVGAHVKGGLLAGLADAGLDLFRDFFDHLFNAGRVDAAVGKARMLIYE